MLLLKQQYGHKISEWWKFIAENKTICDKTTFGLQLQVCAFYSLTKETPLMEEKVADYHIINHYTVCW